MPRLPIPSIGPSVRPRIAALLVVVAILIVLGRVLGAPPGRAAPAPLPPGTLELRALDVGQGDALLLRLDGRAMLVDAGPDALTVRELVLPRLQELGVQRLDYLVLTHADADHIGGAPDLLRALPIGEIVLGDATSGHPVLKEVFRQARDLRIDVRAVGRGDRIGWHPAVQTRVLNPGGELRSDNDRSVVLRVIYGDAAFLLTGDLEAPAESQLLATGLPLRADVLKLGHHGSTSSSSTRFLDAVRPQAALVQVGRQNRFGHPREVVLDRLLARDVAVFRTDLAGDLAVRTDGALITIAVERT